MYIAYLIIVKKKLQNRNIKENFDNKPIEILRITKFIQKLKAVF